MEHNNMTGVITMIFLLLKGKEKKARILPLGRDKSSLPRRDVSNSSVIEAGEKASLARI